MLAFFKVPISSAIYLCDHLTSAWLLMFRLSYAQILLQIFHFCQISLGAQNSLQVYFIINFSVQFSVHIWRYMEDLPLRIFFLIFHPNLPIIGIAWFSLLPHLLMISSQFLLLKVVLLVMPPFGPALVCIPGSPWLALRNIDLLITIFIPGISSRSCFLLSNRVVDAVWSLFVRFSPVPNQ